MDNDIEARRAAAIAELKAALSDLESGEGLTRFVGGHGIQSRVFEFEWDEPSLGIRFRLPCGRLLSDEESQKEDDAEIGAAIRMAVLLLSTVGRPGAASRRVPRFWDNCDDRPATTGHEIWYNSPQIEGAGSSVQERNAK